MTARNRQLPAHGARAILARMDEKQECFSRQVGEWVERRSYWKAAVAIAAKNTRLAWAALHYGEEFRLTKC